MVVRSSNDALDSEESNAHSWRGWQNLGSDLKATLSPTRKMPFLGALKQAEISTILEDFRPFPSPRLEIMWPTMMPYPPKDPLDLEKSSAHRIMSVRLTEQSLIQKNIDPQMYWFGGVWEERTLLRTTRCEREFTKWFHSPNLFLFPS